jgi:hypothetical protein
MEKDEKVSVRQRGVRHSRVRLRLSLAPCGLRDAKVRTGMWDGSLAKCSTSASALRGRKTGGNFGALGGRNMRGKAQM